VGEDRGLDDEDSEEMINVTQISLVGEDGAVCHEGRKGYEDGLS
jgi:hypothetical protein